jgi:hypothetical protein
LLNRSLLPWERGINTSPGTTGYNADTHFVGGQRKIRYNTLDGGVLRNAWHTWFASDDVMDESMGVGV